jgi:hypothetical protein
MGGKGWGSYKLAFASLKAAEMKGVKSCDSESEGWHTRKSMNSQLETSLSVVYCPLERLRSLSVSRAAPKMLRQSANWPSGLRVRPGVGPAKAKELAEF